MSRALDKAKAGSGWMSKMGAISGAVVGALAVGLAIASGGTSLAATALTVAIGSAIGAVAGGLVGALSGAMEGFTVGGLYGSISDAPKPTKVTIVTHGMNTPSPSHDCSHCRSDFRERVDQSRANTPEQRYM